MAYGWDVLFLGLWYIFQGRTVGMPGSYCNHYHCLYLSFVITVIEPVVPMVQCLNFFLTSLESRRLVAEILTSIGVTRV